MAVEELVAQGAQLNLQAALHKGNAAVVAHGELVAVLLRPGQDRPSEMPQTELGTTDERNEREYEASFLH